MKRISSQGKIIIGGTKLARFARKRNKNGVFKSNSRDTPENTIGMAFLSSLNHPELLKNACQSVGCEILPTKYSLRRN